MRYINSAHLILRASCYFISQIWLGTNLMHDFTEIGPANFLWVFSHLAMNFLWTWACLRNHHKILSFLLLITLVGYLEITRCDMLISTRLLITFLIYLATCSFSNYLYMHIMSVGNYFWLLRWLYTLPVGLTVCVFALIVENCLWLNFWDPVASALLENAEILVWIYKIWVVIALHVYEQLNWLDARRPMNTMI